MIDYEYTYSTFDIGRNIKIAKTLVVENCETYEEYEKQY